MFVLQNSLPTIRYKHANVHQTTLQDFNILKADLKAKGTAVGNRSGELRVLADFVYRSLNSVHNEGSYISFLRTSECVKSSQI